MSGEQEKVVWRTPEASIDDQRSGTSHAWVLFSWPMVALCGAEIGASRKLASKDRTCGKCVDAVRHRVMFPAETPTEVEAVAEAFADHMLVEVRPVLVEMGMTITRAKLAIEEVTIDAVLAYLREDMLPRFPLTERAKRLQIEEMIQEIKDGGWKKYVAKPEST